jgi:hypothetical protein
MKDLEYDEVYCNDSQTTIPFIDIVTVNGRLKSNINKDHLYCPECKMALLKFSNRSSLRRACLSSRKLTDHLLSCSHYYKDASKEEICTHYEALTTAQIQAKLQSAINRFLLSPAHPVHPTVPLEIDDNPAITMIENNGVRERKRLPTRSLNKSIYNPESVIYETPILFYGNIKLKTINCVSKKDFSYNKLAICSKNGNPYCKLFCGYHWDDKTININNDYHIAFIGYYKKNPNSKIPKIEIYANSKQELQQSVLYILIQ